jgi:hypothetical protein
MAAIEHELFRSETATPGEVVQHCRILDQFPPAGRRLHVHFNHARDPE